MREALNAQRGLITMVQESLGQQARRVFSEQASGMLKNYRELSPLRTLHQNYLR
ncbi:MAG: hypothetical protein LW817_01220 [Candidatus Caenarcaniphilales bacterium]|nr:hypothetical protein [Candidatus Caenarcaniphilales bacterium]